MRKFLVLVFLVSLPIPGFAQELTGPQLLEKAISYHDPEGKWPRFAGHFQVVMDSPDRPKRTSDITLDLPRTYFKLKASRGGTTTEYILERDSCSLALNGNTTFTAEEAKASQLTCERARLMKDYYSYLYGLPMKLRDPGTRLDPVVQKRVFHGKEYRVLRVTYDKDVGEDTWYFYFDPDTYAMEAYQFFHDESKNDGEYILLSGEERIQEIRMPKVRAWYYNKDNSYLGTDTLLSN